MAWIHLTGHPGPTGTKLPCLLWSSFASRVFNLGVAQQKKRKPPAFVFTSNTFPSNFWLIDCLCVVVCLVYVLTFCLLRQPMQVTKLSMLAIRVVVHHSWSKSSMPLSSDPKTSCRGSSLRAAPAFLFLLVLVRLAHTPVVFVMTR